MCPVAAAAEQVQQAREQAAERARQARITREQWLAGPPPRASRHRTTSARTCWRWHSQLPADLARQSIVDLAMARHNRSCALGTDPSSVVSALVHLAAAMSAEMTLQIAPLHAAIVKCSASRSRRSPASLGSGESISRSASITFVRASSRVRPWLNTPATSGIDAMIQPSSPGS